jgi:protein-tyrosine-phosphatase
VIAECVLNKLGAGRFRAHSAGSRPRGEIHPFARDMLAELGYDVSGLRSKSWDEFAAPDAPNLDFVFTVCDSAAAEPCPIWPGQPVSAHWGVPDPAAASGSDAERRLAFADAHRMLFQRISIFTNLPIESLDRLSLQQRVEDIGKTTADSATPTEETQ